MTTWHELNIDIPSSATGEVDTQCPWCSHTRKKKSARCLSVNVDLGTYYCHHCGVSGGLGTEHKPGDPDPYGAPLRPPKEWQKPRPIPEVATPTLWQKATAWFLEERGIPESVLIRNHVTVASEWCPVCEAFMSHILFPFYRDGVHINTKHRCMRKHFRMEKGAERILYGLPDVAATETIIWVEGEIDKLACDVAGFPHTVSVPDGAPPPDAKNYGSKFDFLTSAEPVITKAKRHIIATDADEPGQALQEELARRIGREKCYRVTWPDGIKDADECLTLAGPEFLRQCITEAEPYPVDGIITIDDIALDLDDLYDHGFDPGVTTGWFRFDHHYRARLGLVTIVTGIASHGKSHFLDAMFVNYALRHGWPFAVCSPENQPLTRHAAGLLSTYRGQPFHDGKNERMTKTEMHEAREWLRTMFAFVLPEEPTIDAILDRVRTLIFRMGVKGVVIDPWNELEHSRPAGMSETEYISQSLSKLRRFAHHHKVHIWLVAHPTKLKVDADGNEPVPTLWDISGSAHFRNKADYGLVVWRNLKDKTAPVQAHVQKIRFSETGELGMVEFTYDVATGRYREAKSW